MQHSNTDSRTDYTTVDTYINNAHVSTNPFICSHCNNIVMLRLGYNSNGYFFYYQCSKRLTSECL